jgi:CRP-like cAMP-binding protein
MNTLEDNLATHPFLKGLSSSHLRILAGAAMPVQFKKNEIIFCEGDVANRFYLIRFGRVALEFNERDAKSVWIHTVEAGDVLGWSWLFPPYYWHFDARALEPVKAIFFYGTRLREACDLDHDFGYEIMKRMTAVVVQRLQATRKQCRKTDV